MKKLLLFILVSSILKAEVPITNLPLFSGTQVGTQDVIPFVNIGTNTTGKLLLSNLFLIPSLQNPNFLGTLTVPTGVFSIVNSPTGVFTSITLNTPTASFVNCGSLSGAKGCIYIQVDGVTQKIPYY
jgi:hypothetical protein